MTLNIQFQICGLILSIMVVSMFLRRKSLNLFSEKIFIHLLSAVVFSLIFDIVSIITIRCFSDLYNIINIIICKVYLFTIPFTCYMFMSYVFTDIYKSRDVFRRKVLIMGIPIIIIAVGICFLPIYYKVEITYVYTYGPSVVLVFGTAITYLFISFIFMIVYRKNISKARKGSILFLCITTMIAGTIELFETKYLLVGFAMGLSMVYIFMRLENPYDHIDKVSGCFNSTAFSYYINELGHAADDKCAITVFLEDFKFVRETFGTQNADKLLGQIAQFLDSFKESLVFRVDDLEFTLIFSDTVNMQQALDNIEKRFKNPFNLIGADINLSVCICCLRDFNILDDINFMKEDMRYFSEEARESASGMIFEIDEETYSQKKEKNHAENTLRWALDENKVQVFFQPIFSTKKHKYTSAEALVRVFDKDGKFLSPEIFIPIAEKNGMILEIGSVVFEKVCHFMSIEKPERFGIEYIEVNLSVVQCMQESLSKELLRIMSKHNIMPQRINLEITETAVVNSKNTLKQNMEELIESNVTFSLDDYGSGYSNLSYVVGLPLTIVKLDKSLVWSAFAKDKAKVAMEFTISMIRSMDMKVLAEGVETEEQYKELERLGIDYIQGYYFSRPLPPERFIQALQNEIPVLAGNM